MNQSSDRTHDRGKTERNRNPAKLRRTRSGKIALCTVSFDVVSVEKKTRGGPFYLCILCCLILQASILSHPEISIMQTYSKPLPFAFFVEHLKPTDYCVTKIACTQWSSNWPGGFEYSQARALRKTIRSETLLRRDTDERRPEMREWQKARQRKARLQAERREESIDTEVLAVEQRGRQKQRRRSGGQKADGRRCFYFSERVKEGKKEKGRLQEVPGHASQVTATAIKQKQKFASRIDVSP